MAVALVATSPIDAFANFANTNTVTLNVGSGLQRFVYGIAMATSGDIHSARSITSATYGGVALTLGPVEQNGYGKFSQTFYGTTTLTGANDLVVNITNNSGDLFIAACGFNGVHQTTPLSDATFNGGSSATPSWAVDSAAGDLVVALAYRSSGTLLDPVPESPAVAITGWSSSDFCPFAWTEVGATSVTINGAASGTIGWSGIAASLKSAVAASGVTPSGIASTTAFGTASLAAGSGGIITTDPLKNNTGSVLASTTIDKIAAIKLSDMTLSATWASQVTNGSGVLTLTHGGLIPTAVYLLLTSSTDGSATGSKIYTAT